MRGILALLFIGLLATNGNPGAGIKSLNPDGVLRTIQDTLQSPNFGGFRTVGNGLAQTLKSRGPVKPGGSGSRRTDVLTRFEHINIKISPVKILHGSHAAAPKKGKLTAL